MEVIHYLLFVAFLILFTVFTESIGLGLVLAFVFTALVRVVGGALGGSLF